MSLEKGEKKPINKADLSKAADRFGERRNTLKSLFAKIENFVHYSLPLLAVGVVGAALSLSADAQKSSAILESSNFSCGRDGAGLLSDVVIPDAEYARTGFDYGVTDKTTQNLIHTVAGYYSSLVYDPALGIFKVCYFPIQTGE